MTEEKGQLMTLDEAIQHCKEKEDCTACGQEHKQLREWLEDYKKLKEKDTPKHVTPSYHSYGFYCCPNCKSEYWHKSVSYCGNCGQKLDWRCEE